MALNNTPDVPAIIPAAQYVTPEVMATYRTIDDVPYKLQAMETVMVFIDSNGNIFNLNGPLAGREGVRLWENLQGEHHLWFEQVVVEGAYQRGGIIDRTNYLTRKINLRVIIGNPGMNNITYRMCESRFWAGQDEVNGGWFGVFTRYTGWRWLKVYPAKTVDTTQKRDPVAYDNNQAIWDINWIAVDPDYVKPALLGQPWVAANSGAADANGYYHGLILAVNRSEQEVHVSYLITGDSSGTCVVQDNNSENMVTLPPIYPTDGDVLVDTDSTHKALIAQNDPHPDEYYAITSAAGLLKFFLQAGGTAAQEALWLRGYVRFLYSIPPYSVVPLHVMHTNINAVITAEVPQRFKRSR